MALWFKYHKATKEDLQNQRMGNKSKFTSPAENILAHHSGWSGVKCEICRRETTRAQLGYSMRFYGKPLCRTCQSLESYRT